MWQEKELNFSPNHLKRILRFFFSLDEHLREFFFKYEILPSENMKYKQPLNFALKRQVQQFFFHNSVAQGGETEEKEELAGLERMICRDNKDRI